MEELLNKLIEKGWCPIGKEYTGPHKPFISLNGDNVHGLQFYYNERWDGDYRLQKVFTLREIVSINSGLWQFVCENGMVKLTEYYGVCNWMFGENKYYDETETEKFYTHRDYQYRLIESALKDESELESFILDNIKL